MASRLDPAEVAAALQVSIGAFVRRLRQVPAHGGLTTPELEALSRLDRGGPATPSDLARAAQVTPQAMGTTLNSLVTRGLAERQPDPDDGRRTVMHLTATGLEVMRSKRSVRTQQLAKALIEGFTPAEREVLMAAAPLIERLGERLGERL